MYVHQILNSVLVLIPSSLHFILLNSSMSVTISTDHKVGYFGRLLGISIGLDGSRLFPYSKKGNQE